ncbi:peptidoglycan editing factor PgeF [Lentibacillus sp. L22]|uniref:peptidoglycan editing factor PgeF n=1 Tax=Lentibacillus TaxID=175304 RepID=UPI0022B10486|nr:peptidoglycan editing factor PgeF [Lentibacillus daqui]
MAEPFNQHTDSILLIDTWKQINPKLCAGFTTRNGGVSKQPFSSFNHGLHVQDDKQDVLNNRKRLAQMLGFPLQDWVGAEQVHATEIITVTDDDKGKGSVSLEDSLAGVDGIITNKPGILCTAFFADCVPLFFFDQTTGYIGIAHAGWKGTVNRMAEKMVKQLQHTGSDVRHLNVIIGPCISQANYEVDQRVIQSIPTQLQKHTVKKLANHRYLLDLKQLNKEILLQCGVFRHNIGITNYCTFRDESLFFSHRRDHGKTGRMLGFIGYIP